MIDLRVMDYDEATEGCKVCGLRDVHQQPEGCLELLVSIIKFLGTTAGEQAVPVLRNCIAEMPAPALVFEEEKPPEPKPLPIAEGPLKPPVTLAPKPVMVTRPVSCECGTCKKCKKRVAQRRFYEKRRVKAHPRPQGQAGIVEDGKRVLQQGPDVSGPAG